MLFVRHNYFKNTMYLRIIITIVFMSALTPISSLYAEVIELNNGQTIEGTIVDKKESSITVEFDTGTIAFHTSEIKSISPSITIHHKSDEPPQKISPVPVASKSITRKVPSPQQTPMTVPHTKKKVPSAQNKYEDVNLDSETDYFIDYFGGREGFLSAFEQFIMIAKKKPDDIENHYKLGLSYFYLKKYEHAITELNTVLQHNPNDLEARRFLGYAHYQTGNIPMAIEQLKKRLDGRPFDSEIRKLLASCYFQLNDLEQASREYETIIDHDPTNTLIILKLSKIYADLGINLRAQELREKAKAIDPTSILE